MADFAKFDFSRLPRICGHRGAKGSAPENTLASIRKAAELGVTFIEFDVNLAGDNEIVVFHDFTLDRCTNGSGLLIDHSYENLKKLDAGSHFDMSFANEKIPRFIDVIALLAELNMGANVEVKSTPGNEEATVAATIQIIRQHWPSDLPVLMSSFSEAIMELLSKQLGDVSRGWLVEDIPKNWQEKLAQFGADSFHCWDDTLQKYHVDNAIDAGYPVLVYTVNDRERAKQLLDWGVAAVISDFPERMIGIVS